jgi:hypothetical protein
MRQKLAFESMKMGNPSSTKGAAGDLGKPPYLEVGERSEPTIFHKDWCEASSEPTIIFIDSTYINFS